MGAIYIPIYIAQSPLIATCNMVITVDAKCGKLK